MSRAIGGSQALALVPTAIAPADKAAMAFVRTMTAMERAIRVVGFTTNRLNATTTQTGKALLSLAAATEKSQRTIQATAAAADKAIRPTRLWLEAVKALGAVALLQGVIQFAKNSVQGLDTLGQTLSYLGTVLAGPLLPVVAAVAAGVMTLADLLWAKLRPNLGAIYQTILQSILPAVAAFVEGLDSAFTFLAETAWPLLKSAMEAIPDVIDQITDAWKELKPHMIAVKETIADLIGYIRENVSTETLLAAGVGFAIGGPVGAATAVALEQGVNWLAKESGKLGVGATMGETGAGDFGGPGGGGGGEWGAVAPGRPSLAKELAEKLRGFKGIDPEVAGKLFDNLDLVVSSMQVQLGKGMAGFKGAGDQAYKTAQTALFGDPIQAKRDRVQLDQLEQLKQAVALLQQQVRQPGMFRP